MDGGGGREGESMIEVGSEEGAGKRSFHGVFRLEATARALGSMLGALGGRWRVFSGRPWWLLCESTQEGARVEAGEAGRKCSQQPWL